ncbi:MAG: thrombospondin type 3 repeat-containing protein [Chloroflexota bacterium]
MRRTYRPFLLVFLALSVAIASAQESCSALVQDALFAVDDFCSDLGRNQACYGNVDLTAQAQPTATDFTFETLGDVVDVEDIASLELSQLDEDAGEWGVAVMSLQADIPNTLPGQNVTFILFGDVSIENASTDAQTPMQAFYLRTGIGTTECEEAPESGLLVQTPDGVEEVTFNINGVDVQIGSTVYFTTDTSTKENELDLVLAPIEGSAAVVFDDETYPAIEGTEIRLPLSEQLLPTGRPALPESYDENRVAPLPLSQLPREVGLAPPLIEERVDELQERVQNGLPPCDVEGLPDCDDILPRLRDGENFAPAERFGERFEEGLNCIPFDEADESDEALPICPPTDRDDRPMPVLAIANDMLDFDADEDGDGIINEFDACPFRAGFEEFQGCASPPPDSDNDGITDALDLCPYREGDEESIGCPELDPDGDVDKDGIRNADDLCPIRPGRPQFDGCPREPLFDDEDCPPRPPRRNQEDCPPRDELDDEYYDDEYYDDYGYDDEYYDDYGYDDEYYDDYGYDDEYYDEYYDDYG